MENRGGVVIGTTYSTLILAAATVGVRIFTKARISHDIRKEDWLLVLAVLFSTAQTVAMTIEVEYGLGTHVDTVSPAALMQNLKALWISIVFYHASIACTKISLLLGYMRIFPQPRIQKASKITIGLVVLYWIYGLLYLMLGCRPTSFFWDTSTPGGYCAPPLDLWLSHTSINIVTDIIILTIPMPVVSTLNLARKTKLWLHGVFALGGVVIVISIFRIPSLILIAHSSDPTWDNVEAASWTTAETNIAILCAAVPQLRALIRHYIPSLVSTDVHSRTEQIPYRQSMIIMESSAKPRDGYGESSQSMSILERNTKTRDGEGDGDSGQSV